MRTSFLFLIGAGERTAQPGFPLRRVAGSDQIGLQVNISQSTYSLIKDEPEFLFTTRGKVQAKGKGEMEMWFVERVLVGAASLNA